MTPAHAATILDQWAAKAKTRETRDVCEMAAALRNDPVENIRQIIENSKANHVAISLPSRCLTLLPPWPFAIRYAGKRLENRSGGVAASLRGYRGLIGLSHSRTDLDRAVVPEEFDAVLTENRQKLEVGALGRRDQWRPFTGKLWLVAELREIMPPTQALGLPWHVPGQWGLMLGRVWEVKPVPCMGGQGAWRSQWCVACKKIVADSHGLTCKTCLSKLASGPACPRLEVITEVA